MLPIQSTGSSRPTPDLATLGVVRIRVAHGCFVRNLLGEIPPPAHRGLSNDLLVTGDAATFLFHTTPTRESPSETAFASTWRSGAISSGRADIFEPRPHCWAGPGHAALSEWPCC